MTWPDIVYLVAGLFLAPCYAVKCRLTFDDLFNYGEVFIFTSIVFFWPIIAVFLVLRWRGK